MAFLGGLTGVGQIREKSDNESRFGAILGTVGALKAAISDEAIKGT